MPKVPAKEAKNAALGIIAIAVLPVAVVGAGIGCLVFRKRLKQLENEPLPGAEHLAPIDRSQRAKRIGRGRKQYERSDTRD